MAISYLKYQAKTLKMTDTDIFLFLAFVKDELEKICVANRNGLGWLQATIAYWQQVPRYSGPGLVDLKLDEYFGDEAKRRILVDAVEKATKRIESIGKTIEGDYLTKKIGGDGLSYGDESTSGIVGNLNRFLSLIEE